MTDDEKALELWRRKKVHWPDRTVATNYLLVLNGHLTIIIYEEDRQEYYEALEASDSRQELEPMCTFLMDQTVKTGERQIAREK